MKKKSKNISYNVAANLICSNKCIKWIWPSHLDSSKGDCFGLVLVVAGVCVCVTVSFFMILGTCQFNAGFLKYFLRLFLVRY